MYTPGLVLHVTKPLKHDNISLQVNLPKGPKNEFVPTPPPPHTHAQKV